MVMVFIYKTVVEINVSIICNDIWRLADQEVLPACGNLWRPLADPTGDPPDPLSIPFRLIR